MLLAAAQQSWDEAVELAEQFGVRNSQATVLAPTGTISFLMDCDTTGIEPDLGLVKTKKLVGGGTMSIVNQTVPRALARLGYSPFQIDSIVAYIDANMSIVGAPHLKAEHLPVFACSMGENVIHYMGHVRMMAAAQPFISGAISKTTRRPSVGPHEPRGGPQPREQVQPRVREIVRRGVREQVLTRNTSHASSRSSSLTRRNVRPSSSRCGSMNATTRRHSCRSDLEISSR